MVRICVTLKPASVRLLSFVLAVVFPLSIVSAVMSSIPAHDEVGRVVAMPELISVVT